MGLFSSFQKNRAARKFRDAQAEHQKLFSEWKKEADTLDEYITVVRDCAEGRIDEQLVDTNDYGFLLNDGERGVAYMPGTLFLEVVRAPSTYSGGYGGVSFPLFGRVRANTGRMRGQVTPGDESIEWTDEGTTMVTTERIMFTGAKRTQEWKFAKMMSITHHAPGYSIFATSGRSKPTGIGFGPDVATEVQFRIELAAAIARNQLPRYLAELEAEKAQHDREMPVPPAPPALA